MFARIFNSVSQGFTDTQQAQNALSTHYADRMPTAVLTGQVRDIPLTAGTQTSMGRVNYTTQSAIFNEEAVPTFSLTDASMKQKQAECASNGGYDSFTRLSNLAANIDMSRTDARCGWMYNTTDPYQGQGAYGDSKVGPYSTTASGTWMWDLNAAKKKFHKEICAEITSCDDLSNSRYANKCGYCTSSNKGVPISGSSLAYPYEAGCMCGKSNLVVSQSTCPKPQPPPPPGTPAAVQYMITRGACDPLPGSGGQVPRDCYISKVQQVGCSDSGALLTALSSGSDSNYIGDLADSLAFNVYQQRASRPINQTYLKTGKQAVNDALGDFQAIRDNAASAANLGLRAAASDLCFNMGDMDEYDFCTEIQPSASLGLVHLNCLQNEFKRAGGQETGAMYPTAANFNQVWLPKGTWKGARDYIQTLKSRASGSQGFMNMLPSMRNIQGFANMGSQTAAVDALLGTPTPRQFRILGNMPGVEVFWFNPGVTDAPIFYGRCILNNIPGMGPGVSYDTAACPPAGIPAGFVYFTNLLPQTPDQKILRLSSDTKTTLNMNSLMPSTYPLNDVDTVNTGTGGIKRCEFSSGLSIPGSVTPKQSSTWSITQSGPNIITGSSLGNTSQQSYELKYMSALGYPCYCDGKTSNGIRLYSQAECNVFNGNYHGNGECTKKEGGSYSWDCRNVNDGTCVKRVPGGWQTFKSPETSLIQDVKAPMIKFAARPNYSKYGCDYPLCDKRLGSNKMKFMPYQNNGPAVVPVLDYAAGSTYDLEQSYMSFKSGAGVMSKFYLNLSSFKTMVFKVRFTRLPPNGVNVTPFVLWPSHPSIDFPTIFLTGKGGNMAQLNVGSFMNQTLNNMPVSGYGVNYAKMGIDGPTIDLNTTYFITLKIDASSSGVVTGLKVGAANIDSDPAGVLKESSVNTWPNSANLENTMVGVSRFIFVKSEQNVEFDLYSIELYDYDFVGSPLQTSANLDWPIIPNSIYA